MTYASNYTNKATIFDNGDTIAGDHVKAIYDQLGEFGSLGNIPGAGSWGSPAFMADAVSAVAATAIERFYFVPIWMGAATGIQAMSLYCGTNGAAGTTIRFGVFNATTLNRPGTLNADCGTVAHDSGAAAHRVVTFSTVTLPVGLSFLTAGVQGTGGVGTCNFGQLSKKGLSADVSSATPPDYVTGGWYATFAGALSSSPALTWEVNQTNRFPDIRVRWS